MASRLDPGCIANQADIQDVYLRLANLFSPRLFFDPQERFFPVDLTSAVDTSSLWMRNPDSPYNAQTSTLLKTQGEINPETDMANASPDYYTTIPGTGTKMLEVGGESFEVPVPLIEKVHQVYASGQVNARLTIYCSICRANEAINRHLIIQPQCRAGDREIWSTIAEGGLLLNYYFYFPAYDSPEIKSEGDWSGITLLLKHPRLDSNGNIMNPEGLPILTCYYRKSLSWPNFSQPPSLNLLAGRLEFRKWDQVEKQTDSVTGLSTHPVVYVSLGRHNCYYEPTMTNIPIYTSDLLTAEDIENGSLTPGPSDRTITGKENWSSDPILYIIPPVWLIALCAKGCEPPISFDPEYTYAQDGEDQARQGGFAGTTGLPGSSYPKTQSENLPENERNLDFDLALVRFDDIKMLSMWSYAGAWGGAISILDYASDGSILREYGFYQGTKRPIMSAWFLWNLFMDWQYGCAGTLEEAVPQDV